MPGDPQECRQHALACEQLAEAAATDRMRLTFLHLSQTWRKLAAELESAQTLMVALNGGAFVVQEVSGGEVMDRDE
jgi:hypothetical protein